MFCGFFKAAAASFLIVNYTQKIVQKKDSCVHKIYPNVKTAAKFLAAVLCNIQFSVGVLFLC